MIIVIIGAGTIGSSIAQYLHDAGNDVIVIDKHKERLDRLTTYLDIQTIHGQACDSAVLEQARVPQAGLVLALTSEEEVNLLAAAAAKFLKARRVVARVRSDHFLKVNRVDYRTLLGIDLTISPELLTSVEIVKFLKNPGALALEFYAQKRVQMRQVELEAGHAYCDKALHELRLPAGVLVALVTRKGEPTIPSGETVLRAGDKVMLMGKTDAIDGMRRTIGSRKEKLDSIVIAGGGEIGLLLAQALEHQARSVKLLELNHERCVELGTNLSRTQVLEGDATDRNFLVDERIGRATVFIAAMQADEDNIMAALLARNLGTGKCIAVVKKPDYTPIIEENTEIDLAPSPRQITASRIMALVKRGLIHNLSLLEDGRVEIIEFTARAGSPLIDVPLKDFKFPVGSLVGMIQHGHEVRIPRGDDCVREGDTVIMLTLAETAPQVEALF